MLVPSKAAAENAQTQLAAGKSFKAVDHGAIDDSSLHEPFVATKGRIDKAFQDAAFSLKTNELSRLVPMDTAYYARSRRSRASASPSATS